MSYNVTCEDKERERDKISRGVGGGGGEDDDGALWEILIIIVLR